MEIPIGLRIKKEVIRQGMPLGKFADKIHVSRTDVYHIFGRKAINSELLKLICIALNHNFFDDLADDIRDRLGDATPKEMLTQEGCCLFCAMATIVNWFTTMTTTKSTSSKRVSVSICW